MCKASIRNIYWMDGWESFVLYIPILMMIVGRKLRIPVVLSCYSTIVKILWWISPRTVNNRQVIPSPISQFFSTFLQQPNICPGLAWPTPDLLVGKKATIKMSFCRKIRNFEMYHQKSTHKTWCLNFLSCNSCFLALIAFLVELRMLNCTFGLA